MDPDAALDLLKEILAGVPRLPGAACIGRHEMFDPVLGNGHQYQRQERARLTEESRNSAPRAPQSGIAPARPLPPN